MTPPPFSFRRMAVAEVATARKSASAHPVALQLAATNRNGWMKRKRPAQTGTSAGGGLVGGRGSISSAAIFLVFLALTVLALEVFYGAFIVDEGHAVAREFYSSGARRPPAPPPSPAPPPPPPSPPTSPPAPSPPPSRPSPSPPPPPAHPAGPSAPPAPADWEFLGFFLRDSETDNQMSAANTATQFDIESCAGACQSPYWIIGMLDGACYCGISASAALSEPLQGCPGHVADENVGYNDEQQGCAEAFAIWSIDSEMLEAHTESRQVDNCHVTIGGVPVSMAHNGQCQDGGLGATSSLCTFGTDGTDCGARRIALPSARRALALEPVPSPAADKRRLDGILDTAIEPSPSPFTQDAAFLRRSSRRVIS